MRYVIKGDYGLYAGYCMVGGELFPLFANHGITKPRSWKTLKGAQVELDKLNKIFQCRYKFEIKEVE